MLEGSAFRKGWEVPPAAAKSAIKRATSLVRRKTMKRPVVVDNELVQVVDQAMCDQLAMRGADILLQAAKLKQTDDHKITDLKRIDAGKANQSIDLKGVAFERVIQPQEETPDEG